MEDSAIIVAVIAAIASVFGIVFSFFLNRYNSKTNKTTTILKEQYLKLISPLHQALQITDAQAMCNTIDVIIQKNYHLLPDKLFDNYTDFKKHILNSKDTHIYPLDTDFAVQVCEFYRILRYKLDYSTIKITKKEKKSEKLLASSNRSKTIKLIIFYIVSLCLFLVSAIFLYFKSNFMKELFDFLFDILSKSLSPIMLLAIVVFGSVGLIAVKSVDE